MEDGSTFVPASVFIHLRELRRDGSDFDATSWWTGRLTRRVRVMPPVQIKELFACSAYFAVSRLCVENESNLRQFAQFVSKILAAADDFDNLLHNFARGLFDFRRQRRAEIEIATALKKLLLSNP
jgi:hypothetical protein